MALAALAGSCVLSILVGTEHVDPHTARSALWHYTDTGDEWIVHDLRLPRTVLGLVVGVAIGVSGALIQGVTRNPLADAQVLGVNAGAGLTVVAAIAYLGVRDVGSFLWFAFAGAAVAVVAVQLLTALGRRAVSPVRMLLAGVAVGAVLDGFSFTIRLHHPRAFDSMRYWDAGALDGKAMSVSAVVGPFVAAGVVLAVVVARSLNLLSLGDDTATALGGRVLRTQVLSVVAVTLLAGAATAAAGPIGFVGLMVPHIVRRVVGPDWRWILLYSVCVGPIVLLLADVAGRVVVAPAELPAGIVTAFIGAPVLIVLIRRARAVEL